MRFVKFQEYQVSCWLQPSQPSPLYQKDILSSPSPYKRFFKWMTVGASAVILGWLFL